MLPAMLRLMIETLLFIVIGLLILAVILIITSRSRKGGGDTSAISGKLDSLEKAQERIDKSVREEIARNREESGKTLKGFNDSIVNSMGEMSNVQKEQLKEFSGRMDKLTETSANKLEAMREDNAKKLEDMRKTVDEKLQSTLEKRLNESFKIVSDHLESVHKGLGEMQKLASGVGDLKRVLTNVKTRGTWGEMQLGNLLAEILTTDQYEENVQTTEHSRDRVEFAIKLPGKDDMEGRTVWLPIDAKFPKEDYERLVVASEEGDKAAVDAAVKALEQRIKLEAKNIQEKYIDPPNTTDFGIMYLPTEGLYGEVLRRPGLVETLQREYRVNVTGPTTLGALLNSLQMGFRTLAIQKQSSEVWKVLAAVKNEFTKFGDVITKVHKKLTEASDVIEGDVAVRTRAINRKLRDVEQLPTADTTPLLDVNVEDEE